MSEIWKFHYCYLNHIEANHPALLRKGVRGYRTRKLRSGHGIFWNNIVQVTYVWFVLTRTYWYSLNFVLDNLHTNTYLLVHTVHNPVLWQKSWFLQHNAIFSLSLTLIVPDRMIKVNETLKPWSLHWRICYSPRVFGIDTTEPMFCAVLQTLSYSLT